MRRERIEDALSETQLLALVETMADMGRPVEDWPKVPAVEGWVVLAALRRFVTTRERASKDRGERLSRRRALVQASARFGLNSRTLESKLNRAQQAGRGASAN